MRKRPVDRGLCKNFVVYFTNDVRDRFVGWDQRACERRPTNYGCWWAGARGLAGPTLRFRDWNFRLSTEY